MGAALSPGKHPLIDSSLVFPAPPSSYSCSSDGLLLLRSRFAAAAAGTPAAVPAFLVVPSPQSHLKHAAALRTARLAAAAASAAAAAAAAASGLPPLQQHRRRSNVEGACTEAAVAAQRAAASDEENERTQQLLKQLDQKRKELQQHMLLLQQLHRQQKQQRVLRRRQPRKAVLPHEMGSAAAAAARCVEGCAAETAAVAAGADAPDAFEAAADSTSSDTAAAPDDSPSGEAAAAGDAAMPGAAPATAAGSYWDTEATGGLSRSDYCIIYFHGNACDANMVRGWLQVVADELGLPILVFEYPGYGLLSGLPSSSVGVDRCAKVALEFLVEQLHFPPEKIILCGRSIGTGPAAYLASRLAKCNLQLGGLVLISPFASLAALAADMAELPESLARLVVTHHWDTEAALQQCQGLPLCIIHGQQDEIIPVSHSRRLLSSIPNSASLRVSHLPPHANHSVGLDPAAMKEEVLQPLLLFLRKVRCAARLKRQQQLHHKKHLEAQARRAAAANAAATAVAAAAADSLVGHLQPQVSRLLRERTSCVCRWQSQQQELLLQQQGRLQQSEKAAATGSVSTRHCIRAPVAAQRSGNSSTIKRHHSVEPRLMRPLVMQHAASSMQQQQPLLHHRSLRLFRSSRLEASSSSTDDDPSAEKAQELKGGSGAGSSLSRASPRAAAVAAAAAAATAAGAAASDASDSAATVAPAAEGNAAKVRLPQAFFGDSDGEASPAAGGAGVAATSVDFLRANSSDSGAVTAVSTAASDAASAAAAERINAARAFLATEAKIHRRLLLACRHIQQQQRQSIAKANVLPKSEPQSAAAPATGSAAPPTASELTRRLGNVGEPACAAAVVEGPVAVVTDLGASESSRPPRIAGPGTAPAATVAGRGINASHRPFVSAYVKSSSDRMPTAAAGAAAAKKFLSRQRLCHSAAFEGSKRTPPTQEQQQRQEQRQQRRLLHSRRTIGSSTTRATSLGPGSRFWARCTQQEH